MVDFYGANAPPEIFFKKSFKTAPETFDFPARLRYNFFGFDKKPFIFCLVVSQR